MIFLSLHIYIGPADNYEPLPKNNRIDNSLKDSATFEDSWIGLDLHMSAVLPIIWTSIIYKYKVGHHYAFKTWQYNLAITKLHTYNIFTV